MRAYDVALLLRQRRCGRISTLKPTITTSSVYQQRILLTDQPPVVVTRPDLLARRRCARICYAVYGVVETSTLNMRSCDHTQQTALTITRHRAISCRPTPVSRRQTSFAA